MSYVAEHWGYSVGAGLDRLLKTLVLDMCWHGKLRQQAAVTSLKHSLPGTGFMVEHTFQEIKLAGYRTQARKS